jgi:sarcosine dehydrogenase
LSSKAAPQLPDEADAVIVGGGVLGTSVAYHLQERGLKTILLERHALTAGTTWHTAGMLWRLRPSDADIELHTYTREKCISMEEETGINSWVENGGLFIANNKERLAEYQRLWTLGQYYGIDSQMLSPKEALDVYPILNVDDVYGAMHSPTDGTIDPAGITQQFKKKAHGLGGRFVEGCAVEAVETEEYSVHGVPQRRIVAVRAGGGQRIKTPLVVNCAGAWANELCDMMDVKIPLRACKHAYIVTESMEGVHPGLPNLRDHDLSIYFKTQGDSLALGGYEQNPEFWPDVDPGFEFGLFDLDWDTFGQNLNGHIQRCPQIETVGIKSTVCGPESFTPDHKPLVGPDVDLRGLMHCCGFNSMGMMLGGGVGREVANWAVDGAPRLDMFSMDIARYHPSGCRDNRWIEDRTHESYAKTYSIVFPHDEPLAGRELRKSMLFETLLEKGCVYQSRQGFERPGFFDPSLVGGSAQCKPYDFYGAYEGKISGLDREAPPPNGDHPYYKAVENECTFGWGASTQLVADECLAVRTGVAVFDQSYFGKFFIEGPEAAKAVDWLSTARMDNSRPDGSVAYTTLCNALGGIEADLTVTKVSDQQIYIAAGGTTFTHDWRWISTELEKSGYNAKLRNATDDYCMISVQGPYSQILIKSLTDSPIDDDTFLPFSSMRQLKVAGHETMLLRLTFVGELGYEFHVPATSAVALYEALWAEGQKLAATGVRVANAGYRAIDSLSAEKNYRHWHADLSCRDTPFEAGIGFVALAKLKTDSPFMGREALEKHRAEGLRRRLVTLLLDEQRPETPLHGRETIWRGDECVGYIRSTAFGFSIGKQIAYGYVDAPGREPLQPKQFTEWMNASSSWSIGDRCAHRPATVLKPGQAPFDPKNLRIKGEYPPEVYSEPGARPQPREHLLDPLLPVS